MKRSVSLAGSTVAIALAVLLNLLTIASDTVADEVSDEARSRQLFDSASEKYDAGDREEALRLYQESYALVRRAKTLLNVGVVLSELDRPADAANSLAKYVSDPNADRERLPKVKELLAALDSKLLRLNLDLAGKGGISINHVEVGGAILTEVRRVKPGTHVIAVGQESKIVTGVAGETKLVYLRNLPGAAAAAGAETAAGASAGKETGMSAGGTSIGPPTRPEHDGPSLVSHPALWTGAVALVAAGVGTGFAFAFRSAQADLEDINENSPDFSFTEALKQQDKAKSRALAANIAFGVAGAAAAATIVLALVLDRDSDQSSSRSSEQALTPRMTPLVSPNGIGVDIGVGVTGRF